MKINVNTNFKFNFETFNNEYFKGQDSGVNVLLPLLLPNGDIYRNAHPTLIVSNEIYFSILYQAILQTTYRAISRLS